MSLKVWIPFKDGTVKNQGTSNISITNNGATVDNSGKIGKCYNFNNLYLTMPAPLNSSTTYFSISAWVYVTSLANSYGPIYNSRTSGSGGGIVLWMVSSGFRMDDGAEWDLSYSYPTNTWIHVCYTRDPSKKKLYLNGTLIGEANSGNLSGINTTAYIAKDLINPSSYYLNGKLNDVRIYDNCLTPQEVKEISKGLVLHYPLNDTLVLTNVFNYPTFNTSNSNGGWSHWGPSGATASWLLNTNKDYIFNKNNTYSHKFLHTGGSYYIVYQSPAFEGGYRSALAIIKMEGGEYPHNISFGQNATVGTNPPTTFTALGDGFYLMKHEGFRQDGSDDLVSIFINNNVTVYISEAYLENDRQVCSNLFKTTNIVYDSSGYNNNGTITGTLTNIADSARYDKSAYFHNNGIITNYSNNGLEEFTYSAWIKLNSYPGERSCISIGGTYFTINSEGKLSGYAYGKTPDNGYVNGTTIIPLNTWTHVALVWTSTQLLGYVNGEVDVTYNCSGTFNRSINPLHCIGSEYGDGSHRIFNGYISDLREYATALSSDDIKALYNEAAYINYKGDVGCYEFKENSNNLLRTELTIVNGANTSRCGRWGTRNGVPCMLFGGSDYYFGSGDSRNSKMLLGQFKENTQYLFDLWIDVDDVGNTSTSTNVDAGFLGTLYNGSTYTTIPVGKLTARGNMTNPIGFQHIRYISPAGQSVYTMYGHYNYGTTFYVRWDSMIIPIESETDLHKYGILESGQFREGSNIAQVGYGSHVDSNQLIEI